MGHSRLLTTFVKRQLQSNKKDCTAKSNQTMTSQDKPVATAAAAPRKLVSEAAGDQQGLYDARQVSTFVCILDQAGLALH